MLNYKLFSQGMVRLNNFFKKADNSELFLKDYYKAIQELTEEQFNRSIDYLIKNHHNHFFPIPSEMFKAVAETRPRPEVTPAQFQIAQKGEPIPESVKKMMEKVLKKTSMEVG